MDGISKEIYQEILTAIVNLNGQSDLLSILGSYRDTLTDAEVLSQLREWNMAKRGK